MRMGCLEQLTSVPAFRFMGSGFRVYNGPSYSEHRIRVWAGVYGKGLRGFQDFEPVKRE